MHNVTVSDYWSLQECQWHHWLSCRSIGRASLVLWFPIYRLLTGVSTPRKPWWFFMKLFVVLHAKLLLMDFKNNLLFTNHYCSFLCRLIWTVLIFMPIFPSLRSLSVFHQPSLWVKGNFQTIHDSCPKFILYHYLFCFCSSLSPLILIL